MDMQSNSTSSDDGNRCLFPFFASVITFNFAVVVYQSLDRPLAAAFVVFTYSVLVLFLWCLDQAERETNAAKKEKLRVAILVLPTVLVAMFAYRIAAFMTPAGRVALWIMVGLFVACSLYAIYDYSTADRKQLQPQPLPQQNAGDCTYESYSCSSFGTVKIKIVVL